MELLSEDMLPFTCRFPGDSVGTSLQVHVESHKHIGYHSIHYTGSQPQNTSEEEDRFGGIWECLLPNFEPEGRVNRDKISGDINWYRKSSEGHIFPLPCLTSRCYIGNKSHK